MIGYAKPLKLNPFKVGDEVCLVENVLARHARSVPAHAGYTTEQFKWRNTLRTLAGCVGIVSKVFPDGKCTNVDFNASEFKGTIGIDFTELLSKQAYLDRLALTNEILDEIQKG